MKEFIKLAGTLFIITFAAAALLGGVNALTEERIEAAALEKQNAAMQALLPEADSFTALSEAVFEGSSGGEVVGYCVNTTSAGYGGDISLMVGIRLDASVSGIEILSNSETAGLGANCTSEDFKSQFAGLEYPITVTKGSAGDGQISAITGATITSRAVADGVNSAYEVLAETINTVGEGGGN